MNIKSLLFIISFSTTLSQSLFATKEIDDLKAHLKNLQQSLLKTKEKCTTLSKNLGTLATNLSELSKPTPTLGEELKAKINSLKPASGSGDAKVVTSSGYKKPSEVIFSPLGTKKTDTKRRELAVNQYDLPNFIKDKAWQSVAEDAENEKILTPEQIKLLKKPRKTSYDIGEIQEIKNGKYVDDHSNKVKTYEKILNKDNKDSEKSTLITEWKSQGLDREGTLAQFIDNKAWDDIVIQFKNDQKVLNQDLNLLGRPNKDAEDLEGIEELDKRGNNYKILHNEKVQEYQRILGGNDAETKSKLIKEWEEKRKSNELEKQLAIKFFKDLASLGKYKAKTKREIALEIRKIIDMPATYLKEPEKDSYYSKDFDASFEQFKTFCKEHDALDVLKPYYTSANSKNDFKHIQRYFLDIFPYNSNGPAFEKGLLNLPSTYTIQDSKKSITVDQLKTFATFLGIPILGRPKVKLPTDGNEELLSNNYDMLQEKLFFITNPILAYQFKEAYDNWLQLPRLNKEEWSAIKDHTDHPELIAKNFEEYINFLEEKCNEHLDPLLSPLKIKIEPLKKKTLGGIVAKFKEKYEKIENKSDENYLKSKDYFDKLESLNTSVEIFKKFFRSLTAGTLFNLRKYNQDHFENLYNALFKTSQEKLAVITRHKKAKPSNEAVETVRITKFAEQLAKFGIAHIDADYDMALETLFFNQPENKSIKDQFIKIYKDNSNEISNDQFNDIVITETIPLNEFGMKKGNKFIEDKITFTDNFQQNTIKTPAPKTASTIAITEAVSKSSDTVTVAYKIANTFFNATTVDPKTNFNSTRGYRSEHFKRLYEALTK